MAKFKVNANFNTSMTATQIVEAISLQQAIIKVLTNKKLKWDANSELKVTSK